MADLNRRGFLTGVSAMAVVAGLPAGASAPVEMVTAAERPPLTLANLKDWSEQALAVLEKHYPDYLNDSLFRAEEGDNYHGLKISCDCPPERAARIGGCNCQWHPLAGTPMVGGMSGYYEPEWAEQTTYELLSHILHWTEKPDAMTDAEWAAALAVVGLTPASHADQMARLERDMEAMCAEEASPQDGGGNGR